MNVMTAEQRNFVKQLRSVSIQIADWARGQFEVCGASVEDVKRRLNDAVKVAERY